MKGNVYQNESIFMLSKLFYFKITELLIKIKNQNINQNIILKNYSNKTKMLFWKFNLMF